MQCVFEHLLRGAGGGGVFDVWDASESRGLWGEACIGKEEKEEEEASG